MSRLWASWLHLFISPDRVLDLHAATNAQPQTESTHRTGGPAGTATVGMADAVIESIHSLLEQRRERHVDWTISNHLVRYATVPWTSALKRGAEDQAWIGIALEDRYGESMADWLAIASPNGFGCNRLAAALHRSLVQQLHEMCDNHNKQVGRIEPLLTVQLNRHRRRFRAERYFFAVAEPGKLVLVLVDRDNYLMAGSWRYRENVVDELCRIVRRESVVLGVPAALPIYLWPMPELRTSIEAAGPSQVIVMGDDFRARRPRLPMGLRAMLQRKEVAKASHA